MGGRTFKGRRERWEKDGATLDADARAMLEGIARHPSDLERRDVFADWCEEHGDPERAAFIRCQRAGRDVPDLRAGMARAWFPPWWGSGLTVSAGRKQCRLYGPGYAFIRGGSRPPERVVRRIIDIRHGFPCALTIPMAEWMHSGPDLAQRWPLVQAWPIGLEPHSVSEPVAFNALAGLETRTVFRWPREHERNGLPERIWDAMEQRQGRTAFRDFIDAYCALFLACVDWARGVAFGESVPFDPLQP